MSEIKPAMTPEQWAESPLVYGILGFEHKIAAAALHAQPFGFTWDDVDDMLEWADEETCWCDNEICTVRARSARINDIAERIAALLPPRETT